jgi:hypothetical protein
VALSWPNRNNQMANQVAALASRELPVMMGETLAITTGLGPLGQSAGRNGRGDEGSLAQTMVKEARYR